MQKLKGSRLDSLASIVSAFALFSSTLGCEISPKMEERIEVASSIGLGVDPAEIAKQRRIEEIVSEVETLLSHFKNGGIGRTEAIAEFQNLCDELGELIQENVEDDDDKAATRLRVQHSGMTLLLEMDNLREGISALLYGTEPRTREEMRDAARRIRSDHN